MRRELGMLIALVVGMLLFDERYYFFPIQLACQLGLATVANAELIRLLGPNRAPIVPLCYLGILSLTLFIL